MSEDAIRRTLGEYCQALDDGRFDDWVELLTDDVKFGVMGDELDGREAVRAFVEPTQPAHARGRHVLSEPVIELDGASARARTDYVFVAKDFAVRSAGRYHDVLVDDGDRWRIRRREIVFVGDEPMGVCDR